MKKRWTALLLALAMLSALAVGALADEQDKEKTAAEETAQTTPDAAGTLSFENLGARMRTGNYTLLSLEENVAAIECLDYDKMYEDLRNGLNSIASAQWGLIQMGQGESYTYETLTQRYDALRKTFDDIKEGKLQQDNADLVRQLRNAQASLLAAGESLYVGLLALEDQSAALTRQNAALDRTIEEVKLRYDLGQISAMTLQQTEAGKAQVESGKAAIDAAAAQLRRQLNAMIGEELTAPLTLNALPGVTAEQLAAMDVEKDLEKAKAASYDLYAAKLTLEDADDRYANPRNLAAGTLALDKTNLDKVKERNVTFTPFTLVHTDEVIRSWGARMDYLDQMGFTTVERERTSAKDLPDAIARWTKKVDSGEMGIPVDGLVITYDDTDYAATGSVTGHHATRAGLAYKWADVSADTVLDHIEWSCAASTITPVAVFDPVQLEGTTVTRASLCNVSELERLGIGKDRKTELRIIKANKIIPKCIAVVRAEGSYEVPTACPVCGAATEVRISPISGVKTLRCTDPNCPAKHLKRFVRFASKGGLDIDGLSVQTLHEFVNRGYLRDFADLYHLDAHADEIVKLEGFGEKSCANLLAAIEKSRKVDPIHLIFALCIPNIGADAGKKLIAALGTKGFLSRIESGEGFEDVDGIGVERSNALLNWFADDENKNLFDRLMAELTLEDVAPKQEADGTCKGLSFVITGDVHLFKNRSAFKAYVEQQGGAVTGSVSGKTTYLVSNDGESNSSKTKKANELGVPILSEEEFVSRFGGPESADSAEVQIGIDTLL